MMLLPCPYCGPRNVSEFRYSGEAKSRPEVGTATPEQWRSFLYDHTNPWGWTRESWYHTAGCRRFFQVERHTQTNETKQVGSR